MKFSVLSTALFLLCSTAVNAAAVPVTSAGLAQVQDPVFPEFSGDIQNDLEDLSEPEPEANLFTRTLNIITKRETLKAVTERYMFDTSISSFLKLKKNKTNASKGLIWTDNGCSKSPDNPLGFNFSDSCKRHDFGYRNYKKQKRFTAANRLKIDKKFKADMVASCSKHGSIKKAACNKLAAVYYNMVREFGDN